jgi:Holliday junction resolvase RusA-like endonuclease
VQTHADFREKYKDKMDCLDGERMEHGHHIDNLLKRVASLEEQYSSKMKSRVLIVFPVPKKRGQRTVSGMHHRRRSRKDLDNFFT